MELADKAKLDGNRVVVVDRIVVEMMVDNVIVREAQMRRN
jgi:hypothetical protein